MVGRGLDEGEERRGKRVSGDGGKTRPGAGLMGFGSCDAVSRVRTWSRWRLLLRVPGFRSGERRKRNNSRGTTSAAHDMNEPTYLGKEETRTQFSIGVNGSMAMLCFIKSI